MNPAAKVFSRAELQLIAELAIRHDAYVIADEVYEHIVFDGARHISMLSLPGMRERTVAIGSAGKSFSLHRLEGRLRDRRAGAARPDRQGAPVHHLHHAARPAEGGRLRARQGRRAISAAWRAVFRQKRDRLAEDCAALGLGRHPLPGHLFPHARHEPARDGWRRRGARPADDDRGRRDRGSGLRLLRRRTRRKTIPAALLLEARRGARRGGRADAALAGRSAGRKAA